MTVFSQLRVYLVINTFPPSDQWKSPASWSWAASRHVRPGSPAQPQVMAPGEGGVTAAMIPPRHQNIPHSNLGRGIKHKEINQKRNMAKFDTKPRGEFGKVGTFHWKEHSALNNLTTKTCNYLKSIKKWFFLQGFFIKTVVPTFLGSRP